LGFELGFELGWMNPTISCIGAEFGCYCSSHLVAIAQLVERRLVVPNVAGSSPVGHPKCGWCSELEGSLHRLQFHSPSHPLEHN
jgi:hypothetical protein